MAFIESSTPDQLDSTKLATLGYQVDGDKNKCSHLAIKPSDENEKNLYAFDFRMSSEGEVLKTAVPSSNPRFLNSCRSWAGKNCGLSKEQEEEFARIALIAKNKSECLSNYSKWLSNKESGQYKTWDNSKEDCVRPVFAFEGIPVNSLAAVEQAEIAKYGRACLDWRISKKNSISPNGNPETKSPECRGVNYWFHTGNEFTSQAAWNEHDDLLKKQACTTDRANALSQNKSGEYTYGPGDRPEPCGTTKYLCSGKEYSSLDAYRTTSCGAIPPPPPSPPIPSRCQNFKPLPACSFPGMKTHPLCKCP